MGAGSSAGQTAGAGEEVPGTAALTEVAEPETPPELLVLLEDEEQGEGDAKLLHKNGQISAVNGTAEGQVKLSFRAEDLNGKEAETDIYVGQRDPTTVSQKEEPAETLETMPHEEHSGVGIEPKDGQQTIEEMPVSEEKMEQVEQTSDAQSNEVGFKKVFKFVGFKFTVKKDKTEKTEPVQLLMVKKEEIEANGTEKQEVKSETTEEKSETVEQNQPESLEIENHNERVHSVEEAVEETLSEKDSVGSTPEKTEENPVQAESKAAVEEEKEPKKSPESPTNPLVQETSSPFRKFFTQSWAGLRKRTSFKKSKEDEQQVVEKNEKEQQEMDESETLVEASDKLKDQEPKIEESGEPTSPEEKNEAPLLQEPVEAISAPVAEIATNLKSEESTVSIVEKVDKSLEEEKPPEQHLAPLADIAEVFAEENLEHEVITATSEETTNEREAKVEVVAAEIVKDEMTEVVDLTVSSPEQSSGVKPLSVKPTDDPADSKAALEAAGDVQEHGVQLSSPDASAQKAIEGIANEVELLSSQEKAKLQGSPLRKLFTGSSLKKLSGKKHKTKKGEESKPEERESKPEETAEQLPASSESPEAPEAEKGDSIPSSPEEPIDASSLEKPTTETMQTSEGEGEGATSDGERKKDGITPWASFKKLVTPKKRVKKLSESDKEDEPEKAAKSATMSSTDSANSENQEESKAHEEEPKLEKSTEETKRKVDSSVSWEALICVGSSKKRARKTSDSDEEETQKPIEENQKAEEQEPAGKSTETEPEAPLASSQESDQAQGSPSPDQAGSPSEGEGVSTWASFKKLVTPRRKSKTRMEEKAEESATVLNTEHPTSEGEPGKDESWVSFKKLIPGRKKKKSDGKQEHALVEEGQETVEDEDDSPAVVPLSEYEAAEQEKLEAQQAQETEAVRKGIAPLASCTEDDIEQGQEPSEGLVHAVTVTVVEGERAVTSMEERSPSWISATVTESIQQEDACQEVQQTKQVCQSDVVVEQAVVFKSLAFLNSEASDHTTANEMELTSEAVTALEEAIEVSCAEETTEMVSAVSQLGDSRGTSEESTPVPEAENSEQNLEELKKQTQEVLEEVAEKVRLAEVAKAVTTTTVIEVTFCSSQTNEVGKDIGEVIAAKQESVLNESLLNKTEEEEVHQVEHIEGVEETVIKEVSKVSVETCVVEQDHIQVVESYVVDHEDAREDEGSIEERDGEIVEVRGISKSDEIVLKSSMPLSAVVQPEVKIDEVIIVQQQYQHFAAPQQKLSDQFEVTNHTSGYVPAAVDSESVNVLHKKMVPEVDIVTNLLNDFELTYDGTTRGVSVIAQEIAHVVLGDGIEMPYEEKDQPIQGDAETYQNQIDEKVTDVLHQELCAEKIAVEKNQRESGIGEFGDDESTHFSLVQEELSDVHEEVTVANIPEVETSEARRGSVPITAAAVEEQVVAETVTLMDTSAETQEPVVCPDGPALELESEEHIIKSASQTAAAIMDAAFEAAKGSIGEDSLDTLPQGYAEDMLHQVENEDVCQERSETEIETKRDEFIASVTELHSFTIGQDIIQTVVKETEQFLEATVDNFISKADTGADCEPHVVENELQSEAKLAEELNKQTVDEKRDVIEHFDVAEIILTDVLAIAGDHIEVEIAVSEEVSLSDVEKGEEDCAVSLESHSSTIVEKIIQTAVEEVERVEEEVVRDAAPEGLCEADSTQSPEDVCLVEEMGGVVAKEEDVQNNKTIEASEVSSTVFKESHCSAIVEKITQTAVDEVEELVHEAEPMGLCKADSTRSPEEVSLIEDMAVVVAEEEDLQHKETMEASEVSSTVFIDSHGSTIVEKITQTAVEQVEEKVVHEASSEGLCEAESTQSPDNVCLVEEMAGVTAKGESLQLNETMEASGVSRTVFIESHSSTTIVETIVLTTVTEVDRVEEGVCDTSEVLCEVETNGISESQTAVEGEVSHTTSIESQSSTTAEKLVLTAVEAVEKVDDEVVFNAVSDLANADVCQEIEGADEPTTVPALFDVLCPLMTDSSPEDASAAQGTVETEEQVVTNSASEVPHLLEIDQATIELSVSDLPAIEEAEQQPLEEHQPEQPSSVEQTAKEDIAERGEPAGQAEETVLSQVEVNMVCAQAVLQHTTAVLPEQECSDSLKEKASQPVAAPDKDDVPVKEPSDAKGEVTLQGVDHPTAAFESESPAPQASVTHASATEALSKEGPEAVEQLKETDTEQTVKVQEEHVAHNVQVDLQEVVPNQMEDAVQSKAPEEAHSSEETYHEQSQTKSVSEDS